MTDLIDVISTARDLLNHTNIMAGEIRQLRREAVTAGDRGMVEYCDLAAGIDDRLAAAEASEAGIDDAAHATGVDDADRLQAAVDAWRTCEEAIEAARSDADDE